MGVSDMLKRLFLILFVFISSLPLLYAYTSFKAVNQPALEIKSDKWLNTSALFLKALKGKVVMVEFWTFGCYNCVNVQPYIKQWYKDYKTKGLEIIAVHSPEFGHERKIENVKQYVKDNAITYPVAIDNDFMIWKQYANRYWPAIYLIDKQGRLRYRKIGEGDYAKTERQIQELLKEQ